MQRAELITAIRQELLTTPLPKDGTVRIQCPSCGATEKAMTVSDTDKGVAFHCWRASCGVRGYLNGVVLSSAAPKPKATSSSLTITSLPEEYYQHLPVKRTSIAPKWEPVKRIVLYPVLSYYGEEIALIQRFYKELNDWWSGPKAVLFTTTTKEVPMLHFPLGTRDTLRDTLTVVEDWPSCEAVSRYTPCASLLGTNLSLDVATYLRSLGVRVLNICLDNDALGKSIKLQKELALVFDTVRITLVHKDPKDMTPTELQETFT